MPISREEHVLYTRNELTSYPYYVEIFNILKNENIESYLDIGANVGEFCKFLFEKIPTLKKAYLLEPDFENFSFLEKHTGGIDTDAINMGIFYGSGKYKLEKHGDNVGGFQIMESDTMGISNVTTLENLNLPVVDLIKMDVEGGEFNIIKNSSYLKSVKWLDIEWHHNNTPTTEDYIESYLSMYEVIYIEEDKNRCLLKNKNYE